MFDGSQIVLDPHRDSKARSSGEELAMVGVRAELHLLMSGDPNGTYTLEVV